MVRSPKQQVEHFLKTGEYDSLPAGWGGEWISACKAYDRALREALLEEVKRRTAGLAVPGPAVFDQHAFTRAKVAPMVNGLFPEAEAENVLTMLEKSVIFLTADNLDMVLWHSPWLNTTWDVANLYLLSVGAETLGKKAPLIVGLSAETICYVSQKYFVEKNRFADIVVHEAAHVFHNCKRHTVGLPETRTREFLLNIEYNQRETFAYACEVYSRILELSDKREDRIKLATEVERTFDPPDDSVDLDKFHAAVMAAAGAKNGWKKILELCAPLKRKTALSAKI